MRYYSIIEVRSQEVIKEGIKRILVEMILIKVGSEKVHSISPIILLKTFKEVIKSISITSFFREYFCSRFRTPFSGKTF